MDSRLNTSGMTKRDFIKFLSGGSLGMGLIVHKYGGTSVGSIEKIKNVAKKIAKVKDEGNSVIPSASSFSCPPPPIIHTS